MATGCELKEVERIDRAGFDTRHVTEGPGNIFAVLVGVPNNQWATALTVSTATQFTLARSQFPRLLDLFNIWARTHAFQQSHSGRSFRKSEGGG